MDKDTSKENLLPPCLKVFDRSDTQDIEQAVMDRWAQLRMEGPGMTIAQIEQIKKGEK